MFSVLNVVLLAVVATNSLAAPVFEADVEARQFGGCYDVKVIFARGTYEPPTLGEVIGPQFKIDLHNALPTKSLDVKGLDYTPTLLTFNEGGDEAGALDMVDEVTNTVQKCPFTKIVLSGYDQGGQVVNKAASQLSTEYQAHIAAVVTFGDPDKKNLLPNILQNRRLTICHVGDPMCDVPFTPPLPYPEHINYASDSPTAASFVAARI
ncbi:cutinase [Panaeolus papilionaceus]|nr:cutinase [Panaeolus papilionaceus]